MRVIGVTPAGLSCDQVLHAISDALKVGTTDGCLVDAPDGHPIRLFVYFFSTWGRYPHVSKSSFLCCHMAVALCLLCAAQICSGERCRHGGTSCSPDTVLVRTTAWTLAVLPAIQEFDF